MLKIVEVTNSHIRQCLTFSKVQVYGEGPRFCDALLWRSPRSHALNQCTMEERRFACASATDNKLVVFAQNLAEESVVTRGWAALTAMVALSEKCQPNRQPARGSFRNQRFVTLGSMRRIRIALMCSVLAHG